MFDRARIFAAAREIRPVLPKLLGEDAKGVDDELRRLLDEADGGAKVDNLILDVLRRHEATRTWVEGYLGAERPEEWLRSFEGLLGRPTAIPAYRYECPACDYVWSGRSVRDLVPLCPRHQIRLIRSE